MLVKSSSLRGLPSADEARTDLQELHGAVTRSRGNQSHAGQGRQNLTGPANAARERRPIAFAISAASTARPTVSIEIKRSTRRRALSTEASTSNAPAIAELASRPRS